MAIRIELPPSIWEEICNQAGREWRTPKQQAEYLILRALGWQWPLAGDSTATKPELEETSVPSTSGEAAT